MMLGMATGKNNLVSVQDFGLDNRTNADGLAVGRASGFVGALMRSFISGCYSLSDQRMLQMLAQLADTEQICLKPSALAGMYGPVLLSRSPAFRGYLAEKKLTDHLADSTQLVWATGGTMVSREVMEEYRQTGKRLLKEQKS